MLGQIFNALLVVSAIFAVVLANPISVHGHPSAGVSFNDWGHLSSLRNFDSFYGIDNFSGIVTNQIFIENDRHLVCHSRVVRIVQQRLLVIQELAKRVITEQICDVETQTIVFEQFHAGLGHFSGDLRRVSGNRVGFDSSIAARFRQIVGRDGRLSTHYLLFSGRDLARHLIAMAGTNWDDHASPASVGHAYAATLEAVGRV